MVPVGMENSYVQRHNMTVHSLVSYNASSDELFIDGLEREKSLVRKGVMLYLFHYFLVSKWDSRYQNFKCFTSILLNLFKPKQKTKRYLQIVLFPRILESYFRRKRKDCLARIQNNVSERSSTCLYLQTVIFAC
jgi:hypothetical protein